MRQKCLIPMMAPNIVWNWNCYGATKNAGCAFGTPDGDVIKELGFSTSMEVKFTFHKLFAVPQW